MKIGFDAKRAFLNTSGLGNYSRNTLFALRTYFPGYNYLLFTPEINRKVFDDYKQFTIVSPQNIVFKKLGSFWRSFFLVSLARRHQVDLFHGLSNELPRGIRNSGIPSVVTIHDVVFMRYPEFYKSVDRKIYFKKVKHACKSATRIIAISRQTKQDLVTFFNVPPERIEIIHQPVAPVFFSNPVTTNVKTKYNLPDKFLLSVGTIEPRKNQLVVLQAVQSAGLNIPVVFVGKNTGYTLKLKKYIAEHKMEAQVMFLTGLPEKDLAYIYRLASLSVYISVFEGFGLPVIESMASGCPVITSSVSVLPETAGDAAVLCNPADPETLGMKIRMLLEEEETTQHYIRKGVERAKLFHPAAYAEKIIMLYKQLINNK